MLNTNCESLRPEIMDVLRIFGYENADFTHYFSYGDGEYYNCIEHGDKFYDYSEKYNPEDDIEHLRYARRFAKLAFYKLLSSVTGVNLPWGALTGIRPTKMAYMEKSAERDFKKLFKSLCVSEENIALVDSVLRAQSAIYAQNNGNGCDIFISLPFCPSKCEYCSFITAPIDKTAKYVESYIDCLVNEINSLSPILDKVNSVYIGGGTPFTVDFNSLERVLKAVKGLNLPNVEYTVEAGRPDTFTREKLRLCKDYGVTRICVNPQSFSDETLKAIGRKHTVEDMYSAYNMAREYGFDINIDLIAGLEHEGLKEFENSLRRAIELEPENITVHTLSLKSGAKLKENVERLNIDGITEMILLSRELLTSSGYIPYYMYRQKYQAGANENVGWCKEGKACVYNVDVMEEICSNVAVGANAISKRVFAEENRIERFPTPKDIPTYLNKCAVLIDGRKKFFE